MSDQLEPVGNEGPDLSTLPRESIPPADLEDRTVRALRAHGLLKSRVRWLTAAGLAVAAATLVFMTGFGIGRRTAQQAPDEPLPSQSATTRVVAWF
jgi:hypothetical protein